MAQSALRLGAGQGEDMTRPATIGLALYYMGFVARYFSLSEIEVAGCREALMRYPTEALKCYRAIYASIGN